MTRSAVLLASIALIGSYLMLAPVASAGPAGDAITALEARVTNLEAELAKLKPTPTPLVSPTPSATSSVTPIPSVAPSVSPTPTTAPPTPVPSAAACGASLQAVVDAAAAGSTLNLTGCTYTSFVSVNKPLTLIGATISDAANTDAWKAEVSIGADDVTLDGLKILDGGQGVAIYGRSRVSIKRTTFRSLRGGAIAMWGEGRGSNDVLIEANDIAQSEGGHVSPIGGRGSEGSNPCPVVNKRTTIRGNVMDQGNQTIGWFGIELKCHEDVLIEGNRLSGGQVLVSLPDNNRVTVRDNDFLLGLFPRAYWGIEVAKAYDVTVVANRFVGQPGAGTAVELNSGQLRALITANKARDLRALVSGGGGGTVITDNCLTNVSAVRENIPAGNTDTVARNGPCP